jgi:hypothetical protein
MSPSTSGPDNLPLGYDNLPVIQDNLPFVPNAIHLKVQRKLDYIQLSARSTLLVAGS